MMYNGLQPGRPDGRAWKSGGDRIPAEDNAMRCQSALKTATLGLLGASTLATALWAQGAGPGTPWRGAGAPPCYYGTDGSTSKCVPAGGVVAIRAGQLFDSKTGQMAARQIVLLQG